jgi:MinD superfamily P-loop ATPase
MRQIVIISGKGGTGKTSLSAALATMDERLMVADCDVDAANLHLLLELTDHSRHPFPTGAKALIDQQRCTQCGACMDLCRFDAIRYQEDHYTISETSCDGCYLCMRICPADAISMIESNGSYWTTGTFRNGWMVHAQLEPGEENSGKLVNVVRKQSLQLSEQMGVETILIDGPPGTGCPAISAMSGANLAVLVTEPSRSGFHDLKRIKQLADGFDIPSVVVINKYDLNEQVTTEIESWCRSERLSLIGKIPFEPAVVEAMLQCQSVVEWAPRSAAADEITAIHRQIFQS